MENTIKKYIGMESMSIYNELFKQYVDNVNAANIKSIKVNNDSGVVSFYKEETPNETSVPLVSFNVSEVANQGVVSKVENATAGSIPVLTEDGGISGSTIKLEDVAIKTQVVLDIATAIQNATHISKQIVDTLPTVEEVKENVWYLLKDETVTGEDKYKEYLKIGDELVCVGSTSMDLSEYARTSDVTEAITTATNPITEKITGLETNVNNFVPASEDDIRALFAPPAEN